MDGVADVEGATAGRERGDEETSVDASGDVVTSALGEEASRIGEDSASTFAAEMGVTNESNSSALGDVCCSDDAGASALPVTLPFPASNCCFSSTTVFDIVTMGSCWSMDSVSGDGWEVACATAFPSSTSCSFSSATTAGTCCTS